LVETAFRASKIKGFRWEKVCFQPLIIQGIKVFFSTQASASLKDHHGKAKENPQDFTLFFCENVKNKVNYNRKVFHFKLIKFVEKVEKPLFSAGIYLFYQRIDRFFEVFIIRQGGFQFFNAVHDR